MGIHRIVTMSHNNQLIEQIFFVAKDIASGKEEFYEVNEQYISMISPYIRSSEATNIFLAQLYAVLDKIIDRLAKSSLTIKDEPSNPEGPEGDGMNNEDAMYMPDIHNNNNPDSYSQKQIFAIDESNYSLYVGDSFQSTGNTNFIAEDHKDVQVNNIQSSFERSEDNMNLTQSEFKEEPNCNGFQESKEDNYIEKMIHYKITQLFLNEDQTGMNAHNVTQSYLNYPTNNEAFNQPYPTETSYHGFKELKEPNNY